MKTLNRRTHRLARYLGLHQPEWIEERSSGNAELAVSVLLWGCLVFWGSCALCVLWLATR
jgi:hypothetical protein